MLKRERRWRGHDVAHHCFCRFIEYFFHMKGKRHETKAWAKDGVLCLPKMYHEITPEDSSYRPL
jgi:hypothetical protein